MGNDDGELTTFLNKYLQSLRARNYAKHTLKEHQRFLGNFIDYCHDNGIRSAIEVSRDFAEGYQVYLSEYRKADGQKLSVRVQHNWLLSVKLFFKWLAKKRHIIYNPASEIELPKLDYTLPNSILTAKEAELVMIQTDIENPLGLRDRAILETMYSTAMRRMEVQNLCLGDISYEMGTVMIKRGKGGKARVVPLGIGP